MKVCEDVPILDDILRSWSASLGADFAAYRNHCYRVLNFCLVLCGESAEAMSKISVAAAFHDLGIWTSSTFDYLEPSRVLAREYLAKTDHGAWSDEIEAMIEQHHKLTKYKVNPEWLVEPFRKADWIDVSRGRLRFGLPSTSVAEILSTFPNAGFHRRLVALTAQRIKTHPFSPLPMVRF